MPTLPLDPSVIENAPVEIETIDGDNAQALAVAYEEIGLLSDALAESEAEIARLEGLQTVEAVRARLIEPYANKVFWFVVGYCVVVGAFLLLDGFEAGGFGLKETTIGIIAGSTAIAVIGLIGMVISGLFGRGMK